MNDRQTAENNSEKQASCEVEDEKTVVEVQQQLLHGRLPHRSMRFRPGPKHTGHSGKGLASSLGCAGADVLSGDSARNASGGIVSEGRERAGDSACMSGRTAFVGA
jgi:hypothetical protein